MCRHMRPRTIKAKILVKKLPMTAALTVRTSEKKRTAENIEGAEGAGHVEDEDEGADDSDDDAGTVEETVDEKSGDDEGDDDVAPTAIFVVVERRAFRGLSKGGARASRKQVGRGGQCNF